jgi:hypothetical protein
MCIGRNCHKKVSDAVNVMWQRVSPSSFREAMRRNCMRTDDDVVQALVTNKEQVRELVGKSLVAPTTSTEAAACYQGAIHELRGVQQLGDHEKQLLEATIKKNYYTTYGTRAEGEMLSYIRDVLQIPCHTDPAFHKQCMGEVTVNGTPIPWYIGGKIDALSDDGTLLIEIKNRVNRLFGKAPEYEKVQVQTYLHLLNINHGVLVECFKASNGGVQTNVIPIARDKRYWLDTVVPRLTRFVTFVLTLIHNTDLQDAFLQSNWPSALVGL